MKYISIIILSMISFNAYALTYQLGVDDVKPINCNNPTTRSDGTPLSKADIKEVRITVTGPGSYSKVVPMLGGCVTSNLPLTGLSAGTYQMVGVTEDNGGRVSANSPAVPFILLAPVATPNPPTVLP